MIGRSLAAAAMAVSLAMGGASVRLGGALFPRFSYSPMGNTFELMGAEANLEAQVTGETRDIVTALIQVRAGGAMGDWTSGFHFGQAYALLPLGLSLPTVKVGQSVIPFGLLADYDIHTQIIQTSFARTLGLRLDPGLGILGAIGQWDYRLWLSNGNGPDMMDNDANKVITARIAPRFLIGDADVSLGLSGLAGSLPYWSLDSLASMVEGPRSYAMKYRLGLDNTTDWGPLTLRLEGVAGRDSALSRPLVFGYYAEARYAIVRWLEGLAKYDGFHTGGGRSNDLSLGLNFYPPDVSAYEVQTVYQRDWLKTGGQDEDDWKLAAQLVVRF